RPGKPGRRLPCLNRSGASGIITSISHQAPAPRELAGLAAHGVRDPMRITQNLSALTLKGVDGGACQALGVQAGAAAVDGVVSFLTARFIDHSQALTQALQRANERAWKALEVALAGDSFWDRCKLAFS